jgi:acid phosphatase (class A)
VRLSDVMTMHTKRAAALAAMLAATLASTCLHVAQAQSAPATAASAHTAAASSSAAATAPPAPGWVQISDAQLKALLPPWPTPDSLAGRADVWAAMLAQGQRTPEQAAEAEADATRGAVAWAAAALADTAVGPRLLSAAAVPATAALLSGLQRDGRVLIQRANAVNANRPRPRTVAGFTPSLQSERRPGHDHSAWPSARATTSLLWAETLALVLPEHAQRLRDAAQRTGSLRVIGGAHFPSDIVAAQGLAAAVWLQLKDEPRFLAAVALARAEWPAPQAAMPSAVGSP